MIRTYTTLIVIAFSFVLLALAALYLRDNNILFGPRASQPAPPAGTGVAVIGISPATLSVAPNIDFTLTVTIDTKGQDISGIQTILTYPSNADDFSLVSIDLDSAMAGWTKAFGTQTVSGSEEQIKIGAYTSGSWTSSGKVNFATIRLHSNGVTTKTLTFDPTETKATSGPNSTDVLLTPSETTVVTVATGATPTPTPTPTPVPAATHKVCMNYACTVFAGAGTDECTTTGSSCTPTFSTGAANACNNKYDVNCFDCVEDGKINILDFACFSKAFGQQKVTGTVTWQ